LDKAAGSASDLKIFRRYFNGGCKKYLLCCAKPGNFRTIFELKVEKLGVFPDARRPRVIWCGVTGDVEKLSVLQKQLDSDFAGIGFPREDRPFSGASDPGPD